MSEVSKCNYCEQAVKPVSQSEKQWGTGEPSQGYVHAQGSVDGVPNCGRQFLREYEIHTENEISARTDEY